MEEQEKKTILRNVSVKRNPFTTYAGMLGYIIAAAMTCIKSILPYFIILKKEDDISWTIILWIIGVATLLTFFNEQYFKEAFGLSKDIVRKKTGIEKKEEE